MKDNLVSLHISAFRFH